MVFPSPALPLCGPDTACQRTRSPDGLSRIENKKTIILIDGDFWQICEDTRVFGSRREERVCPAWLDISGGIDLSFGVWEEGKRAVED